VEVLLASGHVVERDWRGGFRADHCDAPMPPFAPARPPQGLQQASLFEAEASWPPPSRRVSARGDLVAALMASPFTRRRKHWRRGRTR